MNSLIAELREIVQARALALGANAVLAFKIELSKIQQKVQPDGSCEVFILVNGIGDAARTERQLT